MEISNKLANLSALLGRILIGGLFAFGGITSALNYEGFLQAVESGFSFWPHFFAIGALLIKILGGLSLVFGLWTRWGLIALIVFTVLATIIYHPVATDPIGFSKNLMLLGGLLAYFGFGPGRYAIDSR
ncbi:MAG: DoxX family protein [Candidatus Campbellbacteria bacterium]|nr:DoxX family protein [Candidatus Campbellbacteria bacterium]